MYREISLKTFSDEKGKLTPIELTDLDLFPVKRVYTVFDNLMDRGGHAHINEEELFFMSKGSCICKLHDGKNWINIKLVAVENAIYVGNMVWHEFTEFSQDAVLTALSSTKYDPSRMDYIEDINKFLENV